MGRGDRQATIEGSQPEHKRCAYKLNPGTIRSKEKYPRMEDNENKEADMPVISMFFGIIITMNADDHVPPHIHARYQGHEASFTFDGNLLKGDLPRKQRKLVEAWVLLHAEELEADWELAFNLEHPFRIDPLR